MNLTGPSALWPQILSFETTLLTMYHIPGHTGGRPTALPSM